jgi:hypothetical protein
MQLMPTRLTARCGSKRVPLDANRRRRDDDLGITAEKHGPIGELDGRVTATKPNSPPTGNGPGKTNALSRSTRCPNMSRMEQLVDITAVDVIGPYRLPEELI